ncbi:MAG: DUF4377 domain-containing protein [Polyangiaceae bacterium]
MRPKALLLLAGLSALTGCATEAETQTIDVNHSQAICTRVVPGLCYQVRQAGGEHWGYDYDVTHGFRPKWGHLYTITRSVQTVDDPPEDGSSLIYTLVEVHSDEAVDPGTTFVLTVPQRWSGDELITREGELEGKIVGHKAFTCQNADVCAKIDAALSASEEEFTITFEFGSPVEDVLIAIDASPAAGSSSTSP